MALPTLDKVWEFRTNIPILGVTNSGASHDYLAMKLKNVLTDTLEGSHIYNEGSIVEVAIGDTYGIDPTGAANDTLYDPAIIGSLAGKIVRVRGATDPDNNGDFTIVGQTAVGGGVFRLDYDNDNGSAEVMTTGISAKALRGDFTLPWIVDHSGTYLNVNGTPGDEVDRLPSIQTVATTAVQDYWVLKNPTTGTQWQLNLDSLSGSNEGNYANVYGTVSPYGFAARTSADGIAPGDTTITYPNGTTATAIFGFNTSSGNWFNGVAEGSSLWNATVNMMMSTDGKHTRIFATYLGFVPLFWADEEVKDPVTGWTNAQVTNMSRSAGSSDAATYGRWNDAAVWIGTDIPSGHGFDDYPIPVFYVSGEGYIDAPVGQKLTVANEVSGNQPFFRMGLVTTAQPARGRHGQLKDIYWTHTNILAGTTFPDNTSREWISVGDVIVPWDGSIPTWII